MVVRFIVIVSLMGVLAGMLVVLAASPVRAALGLVTAFVCMSAVMVAVGADFLGFKCIIVYAGAIIVVFIFVLMLLNLEWAPLRPQGPLRAGPAVIGPPVSRYLIVSATIALALGHALSQNLASSGHFVARAVRAEGASPIGAWCRTSAECIGDALYGWSIY